MNFRAANLPTRTRARPFAYGRGGPRANDHLDLIRSTRIDAGPKRELLINSPRSASSRSPAARSHSQFIHYVHIARCHREERLAHTSVQARDCEHEPSNTSLQTRACARTQLIENLIDKECDAIKLAPLAKHTHGTREQFICVGPLLETVSCRVTE